MMLLRKPLLIVAFYFVLLSSSKLVFFAIEHEQSPDMHRNRRTLFALSADVKVRPPSKNLIQSFIQHIVRNVRSNCFQQDAFQMNLFTQTWYALVPCSMRGHASVHVLFLIFVFLAVENGREQIFFHRGLRQGCLRSM